MAIQASSSQASATISHQTWFWACPSQQRQVAQARVLGAPDPVLAPGPPPVPQFQAGELSAAGADWRCCPICRGVVGRRRVEVGPVVGTAGSKRCHDRAAGVTSTRSWSTGLGLLQALALREFVAVVHQAVT